MRSIHARRIVRLFTAAALVSGAAACDRTPTDGDHAEVAAVRLSVGGQAVTVTDAGVQTGSLTLAQGTHLVAVTWLDAQMNTITELESDLSLDVVQTAGSGVTFTPQGLFGGTLAASAAGTQTVSVRLMHGNHPDFAQNVTFTVQ